MADTEFGGFTRAYTEFGGFTRAYTEVGGFFRVVYRIIHLASHHNMVQREVEI